MKKNISKIILFLFVALSINNVIALAEDFKIQNTGPAPTESKHIDNSRIDTTGGLQIPGGIYSAPNLSGVGIPDFPASNIIIPVSRSALDMYRGPDLLNPCAFFGSTLVSQDDCICEKLMQQIANASSGGGSSGSGTGAGPCGSNIVQGPSSGGSSGAGSSSGSSSGFGSSSGSCSASSGGGSGWVDPCPSGSYCNLDYDQCLQTGETCDGRCRGNDQDPNPPYLPGTWYQLTPTGGYQYDECTYLFDTNNSQWQFINILPVSVNDVPCACDDPQSPCTNEAYNPNSSGGSSGSSTGGSGSSSSGSSSGSLPQQLECPPGSGLTVESILYPSNTCTYAGQTCAGGCRYDPNNDDLVMPFPIYSIGSGNGNANNYQYVSCTYPGPAVQKGISSFLNTAGYIAGASWDHDQDGSTPPIFGPPPIGSPASGVNLFGCPCSSGSC